jgi:hypothetical protein
VIGALFFLLLGTAQAQPAHVDENALAERLTERGFVAHESFKALVVEIETDASGELATRWYDWRGTSDDRDDWWPASTVKLYAAIAALETARAMGYPPSAWLTYHYEAGDTEPVRLRLSQIVRGAIVPSDNASFDRLVELVGFDEMNRRFFSARNGFTGTVFLRAYGGRNRDPSTGHSRNRRSPAITIEHGRRSRRLEARDGSGRFECPDQGNCTTLRELAETMRRLMLHEELPESERFALGEGELTLLRAALVAERREHGQLLVEAIARGFGAGVPLRVYHKPGFAYRWASDVMFLHRTDTGQRWIVAVAACADRRIIDDPLEHIGALIAAGPLEPAR